MMTLKDNLTFRHIIFCHSKFCQIQGELFGFAVFQKELDFLIKIASNWLLMELYGKLVS
jgi:hypothetical protein